MGCNRQQEGRTFSWNVGTLHGVISQKTVMWATCAVKARGLEDRRGLPTVVWAKWAATADVMCAVKFCACADPRHGRMSQRSRIHLGGWWVGEVMKITSSKNYILLWIVTVALVHEERREMELTHFNINPLKTKRRPLYLKIQSVPRCKHFSFGL